MRTMFAILVFFVFVYVDDHSKDPLNENSPAAEKLMLAMTIGGLLCLLQDIQAIIKNL